MNNTFLTLQEITQSEYHLQNNFLKMTASENYASQDVLNSLCSIFSDRYAEGHIKKRFYGACENIDNVEALCELKGREVFKMKHTFFQPSSGSEANLIAYNAIIHYKVTAVFLNEKKVKRITDLNKESFSLLRKKMVSLRVLSMSLQYGGHITHGLRRNISSILFEVFHYETEENGDIDFSSLEEQAISLRIDIIIAGTSAYPLRINFRKMKEVAKVAGAILLADMAHIAGFVAAGIFKNDYNPTLYADIVTSTSHKTFRGPRGGMILTNNDELGNLIRMACPMVIGGPHVNSLVAKTVALEESKTEDYFLYQMQVLKNAQVIARELKKHKIKILYDRTETHLLLIDLNDKDFSGKDLENMLCSIGIMVNRNYLPKDKRSIFLTSGVRLGVSALTTRGMKEEEMQNIAYIISDVIHNFYEIKPADISLFRNKIKAITSRFPLSYIYDKKMQTIESS